MTCDKAKSRHDIEHMSTKTLQIGFCHLHEDFEKIRSMMFEFEFTIAEKEITEKLKVCILQKFLSLTMWKLLKFCESNMYQK